MTTLPGSARLEKYSTTQHARPKTVWVRGRLKRDHWEAVEESNLALVQHWLVEHDTHVDDTDLDGKCAIHWATKEVSRAVLLGVCEPLVLPPRVT